MEILMLSIKVLGPGCENCRSVEAAARNAAANMRVEAEISKITDYSEIKSYHVLATPGLVINEKVVSAARVPAEAEIMTWIADALMES
jgi:small redox-active disulfide protein 2